MFFVFTLFSEEPEVFLPKYSQTAILHAAHFRRVVNLESSGSEHVSSDYIIYLDYQKKFLYFFIIFH